MLRDGERIRWNFNVTDGHTYALVAVCDDLDLRVYDEDGDQVASDTGPDAKPLVLTSVSRSQRYRVSVSMAGCNWNPCR